MTSEGPTVYLFQTMCTYIYSMYFPTFSTLHCQLCYVNIKETSSMMLTLGLWFYLFTICTINNKWIYYLQSWLQTSQVDKKWKNNLSELFLFYKVFIRVFFYLKPNFQFILSFSVNIQILNTKHVFILCTNIQNTHVK